MALSKAMFVQDNFRPHNDNDNDDNSNSNSNDNDNDGGEADLNQHLSALSQQQIAYHQDHERAVQDTLQLLSAANHSNHSHYPSNNNNNNNTIPSPSMANVLAGEWISSRHSDFTLPISNLQASRQATSTMTSSQQQQQQQRFVTNANTNNESSQVTLMATTDNDLVSQSFSPPSTLSWEDMTPPLHQLYQHQQTQPQQEHQQHRSRRPIFSTTVQKRYACQDEHRKIFQTQNEMHNGLKSHFLPQEQPNTPPNLLFTIHKQNNDHNRIMGPGIQSDSPVFGSSSAAAATTTTTAMHDSITSPLGSPIALAMNHQLSLQQPQQPSNTNTKGRGILSTKYLQARHASNHHGQPDVLGLEQVDSQGDDSRPLPSSSDDDNNNTLSSQRRRRRPRMNSDPSIGLYETHDLMTSSFLPPPKQPTHHHHPKQPNSFPRSRTRNKKGPRPHETLHAQSLLLGLAFSAIWTPSNMMAPNLTEMARDFGLTQATQRDLYLGSYCALATGVLSFPISALIGILTDLVSRRNLFVITMLGGAITSAATGACQEYWQLFLLRLVNGGFMAGSVPVAFSFLGDMFSTEDRNAASSGLTAMMGMGIIAGQVYAGMVGVSLGWSHAFYVSGVASLVLAILCAWLIQEPVRGGKEKVLQDMIQAGTRYDRKLTFAGFCHAMKHNKSNSILLWQGFFSSLPWGIIFVFLNDYLSQERGFTVPDATFLVFLFGVGCTIGGVMGGYWGQKVQSWDRSYLPLFMAATTALGIVPFVGLLNTHFTNARGPLGFVFSISAGMIASLPSVNVRPCLLNVNPPETRGASLTAANLLISLGRGVGPSCVTLMVSLLQVDRHVAFNVTLSVFWFISALQLVLLSKTLPVDQDTMEAELARYAKQAMARDNDGGGILDEPNDNNDHAPLDNTHDRDLNESLISIEERMTSFDDQAARQTLLYMKQGIQELRHEMRSKVFLPCGACGSPSEIGSTRSYFSSESSRSNDESADDSDEGEDDNANNGGETRIWRTEDDDNDGVGALETRTANYGSVENDPLSVQSSTIDNPTTPSESTPLV